MQKFAVEIQENDSLIYTDEQLARLDPRRVPRHIAIIPDGNRRWARQNRLSVVQGHRKGADNLLNIVRAAKELGVQVVTFYTISTENLSSRDPLEVSALMWLLESYLQEQRQNMIEQGVRLQSIGDISKFPPRICQELQKSKEATAHCDCIEMVMALNYGGRDEIKRAFLAILDDYEKNTLKREDVTEALISRYLDTAPWGDPDLLIRTSGEQRLSNFLLWQTSYAEMHMPKVFWPDFSAKHLLDALESFQHRERRLGGV